MGGILNAIASPYVDRVQPISPTQAMGQALSLKQLGQQTQIQQQVMAENQAKIAEMNQDVLDQKALKDGYLAAVKAGTPEKWADLAAQNGGSVKAIQTANDLYLKGQQTIASTKSTDLDNSIKQWDGIGRQANALLALPDDQMVAQFPSAAAAGLAKPGQPLPDASDPKAVRDFLTFQAAHGMNVMQQNQLELQKREQANKDAEETRKALASTATELSSLDPNADDFKSQWSTIRGKASKSVQDVTPEVGTASGQQYVKNLLTPPAERPKMTIDEAMAALVAHPDPSTISSSVNAIFDPNNFDNPAAKKEAIRLGGVAKIQAMEALRTPGKGLAGAQAAIKDQADRLAEFQKSLSVSEAEAPQKIQTALAIAAPGHLQQSYQFNSGLLEKAAAPIEQTQQKLSDLKSLIADGSPQAWANIPAKLLSVTTGGQGSGLRMNQALIEQELGGAGKWAELQGLLKQWSLDPKEASKIPQVQRDQVISIVNQLDQKIQSKQGIIDDARQSLIAAPDVTAHRQVVANTQKKLNSIDNAAGNKATTTVKYVRTAVGPNGHKIGQKSDGGWYDVQTGQKVQ